MISKNLAIAAAILLLSGLSVCQAMAQPANQPAGQTAQPATTSPSPDAAGTPGGAPAAGDAAAPAAAAPPPAAADAPKENPYGLGALWAGQGGKPDWVARGVMVILGIMSIGTWYI